ncbi:hypothetical protein [Anaerofustis stercorihominis]|uniref:hypothetical protein n=1 Tax=Anaerofustis stercorihominis TaxID=214853 RepID=UPI00214C324F|nr:hypothetical protein [Anaerofustis stercorihominis]MCR2033719.1 hypothetical protein [Anaerofustis stercorihominis]
MANSINWIQKYTSYEVIWVSSKWGKTTKTKKSASKSGTYSTAKKKVYGSWGTNNATKIQSRGIYYQWYGKKFKSKKKYYVYLYKRKIGIGYVGWKNDNATKLFFTKDMQPKSFDVTFMDIDKESDSLSSGSGRDKSGYISRSRLRAGVVKLKVVFPLMDVSTVSKILSYLSTLYIKINYNGPTGTKEIVCYAGDKTVSQWYFNKWNELTFDLVMV